jgi:peptidoglycan-N-acetylglucosamine deacetylase
MQLPVETPSIRLDRRQMSPGLRSRVKRLIPRSVAIQRLRPSPQPTVLLTFDDGPHPEITPAVLERLDRHDARAVFFVIGWRARRARQVLERIRSAGHVIGNHSHLHRNGYVLADARQASFVSYYRDCARCQTVIARSTGVPPTLFRPPGGRMTPATLVTPRLLGMRSVLWTREVADWRFRRSEDAAAGAVELLRIIAPRDIVLLHDDNRCVLDLLDRLLPELRSRGFDLASGVDLLL